MTKFQMGVVQLDTTNNKEETLKKAEQLVREAAQKGAQFVSLPEYFSFMGADDDDDRQAAETIPGKTTNLLSSLAKELNIWIHGGSMIEEIPNSKKCYNTTVLINSNGEIVAKYSKLHLFDIDIKNGPKSLESDVIEGGNEIVTAETPYAKVGLSICYDVRFPELFRHLALNGAKVLFIPAAFALYTGRDHWETLLRARAIESQTYVIAAGQVGNKPSGQCYGRSMVIDHWGTVIATASDKESVIVTEIDMNLIEEIREQVPSLKNRRSDVYSLS